MSCSPVIDLAAARARRGLPPATVTAMPPPARFRRGQPVTVLNRPIAYGWISAVVWDRAARAWTYRVQTPTGQISCDETRLADRGREEG